jgi:5-methylcytosine-specific restriction endonuclease McrA
VYKAQKQAVTPDYKERNRFYQRKEWKDARALHLQLEENCRKCRLLGMLVKATIVDHVIAIEAGGSELEQSNLQSLCTTHHNSKTRRETKKAR